MNFERLCLDLPRRKSGDQALFDLSKCCEQQVIHLLRTVEGAEGTLPNLSGNLLR